MKLNGKEWGFRIDRCKSGYESFEHLYVRIVNMERYASMDLTVEFKFQCSADSDYWYGGNVKIEVNPASYEFAEGVKIVNKIMGLNEDDGVSSYHYSNVFPSLMERLAKLKVPHVQYDSRLSKFVTEAGMAPVSVSRWVDSYAHLGRNSIEASVLAESQEEARRLIRIELASKSDPDLLKVFMTEGEPVMIADAAKGWVPLEETIRLPNGDSPI